MVSTLSILKKPNLHRAYKNFTAQLHNGAPIGGKFNSTYLQGIFIIFNRNRNEPSFSMKIYEQSGETWGLIRPQG